MNAKADKYPDGQYSTDIDIDFGWPEQVPELTELMLRHGFAEADVRGILGGNWLRMARAVWK